MNKKVIKKLLAVIMIITILATDFYVLGSSIITYAANSSNEIEGYPNIYFSTYFKENEKETKKISKSIKEKDLKLYAKIGVNSDVDYLEDIQIKLNEDNFKVVSSNKGTVEGNTVNLEYITAGSMVEVELGIEPILSNKISADMSLKTNIELNATYKHAEAPDGEKIQAISECTVKYNPDETTEAELEADIITNKVLAVNGVNQRIVQLLIKSRLKENEYPVKQTKLNVNIPNLGETKPEVRTLVVGRLATNGKSEISSSTTENGYLQITLNNDVDENNQVSWNKNIYDEIIVTYTYPETVDASKVEITANSEISLHDSGNTYTARYTKGIENQEPNNVIIGRTEVTTEEMYKGHLYANIDEQYETKTSIIITNPDVADEVVVNEGADIFGASETELTANTKYVATKVNLEKMLAILGEHGNISIQDGEKRVVINKDSEVDKDGNVVINYENSVSEIDITTSGLVNAGVLEINHIKAITGNEYTREQLKTVTTLKTTGSVSGIVTINKEKHDVVSNEMESRNLELKETISKAELTIENNKTELSTTEANEVTLGITLNANGAKYDLYKNPKISLKFPQVVENVQLVSNQIKQNAEEFTVNVGAFDVNNKTMLIELQGEQTTYPESELTQAYIQLKLNITLEKLAISQTDKILMAYTNENATQYQNEINGVGTSQKAVNISAPSQLIKMFNLSLNENTSYTDNILQKVEQKLVGKTLDFGTTLINNKDSKLSNVNILGKLPTTGVTVAGEDENTFETILRGISIENATIYYTENSKATANIEDATNGWTTSLLPNAKLYLIKIDSLERGARLSATVTVEVSNLTTGNALSYTQYEVIYDTETENNVSESSRKIALASSEAASIKTEITAQVGQDILKSGDAVREGEVIRYTVTVNNRGTGILENVQLKLDIPEGTTYVRPITAVLNEEGETVQDSYVFVDGYYEEITETEALTNITIPQLTNAGPYTAEYEVRVNKGTANTEISNNTTVIYDNTEVGSTELKNIVEEAKIRVSIENATNELMQICSGASAWYMVNIENISDTEVSNLGISLISNGFKAQGVKYNENVVFDENNPEKMTINKIDANQMVCFAIKGIIDENVNEISSVVNVNDLQGNIYRSNYIKQTLPTLDMDIEMTGSNNGAIIKEGDIVDYNITIKNIGQVAEIATIKTTIPDALQVQAIYIDGIETKQSSDKNNAETYWKNIPNDIEENVQLEINQIAQIKISAKVGYITESAHGKVIKNNATITALNILEDTSNNVTYILKSSESDIQNVISGMVWFDENKNGQKDEEENTLSDIVVKLYDMNTQSYYKNAEGNNVETITNFNGEYSLPDVKDGSYLIVFEYDTEKYVLTTPYAKNVDSSINSKASIKTIKSDAFITRLAAIEISNLTENTFEMNLGLRENTGDVPKEEQPGVEIIPTKPEDSTEQDKPNTDEPESPENGENTEKPVQQIETTNIKGFVWLDSNQNGQKDLEEIYLPGIKVRLYNVATEDYSKEAVTDNNGIYEFKDVQKGSYIIMFEYNTEDYEPTQNSNIVLKNINVNGKEIVAAVTDKVNVQDNINNLNLGLKQNLTFDLELSKYISKIAVQTSKESKSYDYVEKTLGKVEIHKKQIQGANVVLEYTIKIKNNGEVAGYAKNIVDYLPSGLTFNSELNKEWYLSGNNLYTKSLENTIINPGESKEIKLILTKSMTNDNLGLISNIAEIDQDYNKYGESDIDSTPSNQSQNEDDFGKADVIIQVATGGGENIPYITLLMLNLVLIALAIRMMFKTRIIKVKRKNGRG